jgi:hypothetical protein
MDAEHDANFAVGNRAQPRTGLLQTSSWVYQSPIAGLFAAIGLALSLLVAPLYAADAPDMLPDTTIAPADTGSPTTTPVPRHYVHPASTPAPSAGGGAVTTTTAPIVHHHAVPRPNATPIPNLVFELEPASGRVPLRNDTIVYMQPSKESPQIEQLQAGKLVMVSGSTHFFLQLKLNDGRTGYILADDASLTVPADKIFRLTSDTPVLSRPNKWAKELAEVHQGHDVHVVGVALNYMRIRMKSGLEGYIAITALE